METKDVKDTAAPEVLWPTLLAFAALPRPARRQPTLKQLDGAKTTEAAVREVQKIKAQQ